MFAQPQATVDFNTIQSYDSRSTVQSGRPHRGRERVPGRRIGALVLSRLLGRGTEGAVYKAWHTQLQRCVAVKVARCNSRRHLRHEALILAQVQHRHVVAELDYEDDVPSYLVLEYCDKSLENMISRYGRLPWRWAVAVMRQAATGLAAAHYVGIIHRDVKPANILIRHGRLVKLADFGLALGPAAGERPHRSDSTAVAGTPAYMAPEQARAGGPVDCRSDIYALGATFFHAVTGRIPFPAATVNESLIRHATEPVTPPAELVPEVPGAVSELIVRMLAKNARRRFPDCRALIAELRRVEM